MRSKGIERRSDRLGFTIVELAIVLTIAGVLIGFAIPKIQDAYKQREVNGVRDGVVMLAAVARTRAMEQAETVTFSLNTTTGVAAVIDSGVGRSLNRPTVAPTANGNHKFVPVA